jgi:hypothetical protein
MCRFGSRDCIEKSRQYYKGWRERNETIPVNFFDTVLITVITYGDEKTWFDLFNLAKNTEASNQREIYFRSLTYTRDYRLLKL